MVTTGELIRCPPHFRTIKIGVWCDSGVLCGRLLAGHICMLNLIQGRVVGLCVF